MKRKIRSKRRKTRKGGRAIDYGNTKTWGHSNYYAYNNNPKIFTTSPNYYTQKVGGRKMKGGFFDESRRMFQPLSSFWENTKFTNDGGMRAMNGQYNGVNPSPLRQFNHIKSN